ncbi:nuclease-related domain-containing protein [Psychromonas sp. MME2]|uniref:nuclease-related domain-containing protein n=1 Tax=unclassified Psychromonas TaxID=2614957 RepID=UPI00339C6FA4
MIIKNKDPLTSTDRRKIAGDKQEQDVAFFLRRAFKNTENVFVFNDLRIKYNDEVAQIDHLVLYVYGFILIESKSITGQVSVNSDEEWSRSYNGKWSGMPSPIKQVQLQERLLRELLYEKRESMLDKILFGKLQTGFGGRLWDHFCAISSNAIVQRENMPKQVSKKLVKSEFILDKLNKIIPGTIKNSLYKFSSQPWFTPEEMQKICDFLLAQHQSAHPIKRVVEPQPESQTTNTVHTPTTVPNIAKVSPDSAIAPLSCKKCHAIDNLQPAWGKFGYYVKCCACETNTAMKTHCPACSGKNTKVSKKKTLYSLICQDCNESRVILVQS